MKTIRQCVTVALRKRISDNDIRQLGSWVSLGSPNCESQELKVDGDGWCISLWVGVICTLAMEVAPQKKVCYQVHDYTVPGSIFFRLLHFYRQVVVLSRTHRFSVQHLCKPIRLI